MERAHRVQDRDHGHADVGEHRRPHTGVAGRAEDQHDRFDAEREDDILVHDAHRPACDPDGERDLFEIVIHQNDIRGFNGGIRAHRAHGDADIRAGKDRRVVDAVADERELPVMFLGEEFLDVAHLIGRKQFGMHLVQPELGADRLADRLRVAGQHHGTVNARLAQLADRVRGVRLRFVRND